MDRKLLIKGFSAIAQSILFLVFGFLILWIAKTKFNIQQDAVLVILVLIPVLLYLILSDKLQEFSAGGVSAKFNAVAQRQIVKDEGLELLEIKLLMKESRSALPRYLQELRSHPEKYFTLAVKLGQPYDCEVLLQFLKAMSRFPNFKFFIVLEQGHDTDGEEHNDKIRRETGEETGEVFAYASVSRAIQILRKEQGEANRESSFVADIAREQKKSLLKFYELIKPDVFTTDTNLKALEKMTEEKMDVLIVTDKNHILKGFVEREQLLSKLMLAITK